MLPGQAPGRVGEAGCRASALNLDATAMQVTAASEIEETRVTSLDAWLDALPKSLFGGFDRKATRQLVERLDEICSNLVREREGLLGDLSRMQGLCETLEQHERDLTVQIEGLTSELERTHQENQSLADQLRRARSRWDAELERARAELKRDLEQVEAELVGYRRREVLLQHVAASARSRADTTIAEAREEAERLLRRARQRDHEMLVSAQSEIDRLEREQTRLQSLAADFRHALAARLTATLEELVRPEGHEADDRTAPAGEAGPVPPGWPAAPRA